MKHPLVSVLAVAAFAIVLAVPVSAQERYDVVIRNGRVMDPETGLDAVRNVGINGGSKGTTQCDVDGECTGGDIHGAVWAKTWNGSRSANVARGGSSGRVAGGGGVADCRPRTAVANPSGAAQCR